MHIAARFFSLRMKKKYLIRAFLIGSSGRLGGRSVNPSITSRSSGSCPLILW